MGRLGPIPGTGCERSKQLLGFAGSLNTQGWSWPCLRYVADRQQTSFEVPGAASVAHDTPSARGRPLPCSSEGSPGAADLASWLPMLVPDACSWLRTVLSAQGMNWACLRRESPYWEVAWLQAGGLLSH